MKDLEKLADKAKLLIEKRRCMNCGRKLKAVKDAISGKVTGHQWKCKCSPGVIISIG